jgi:DNA-binding NarL/FixJ family response regulator
MDRTRPLARFAGRRADEAASGAEPPRPIDVLIADSQPIALDAMVHVFDQPGFNVIAGCGTCDEAIAVLRTHQPDVVIFDFDVPPDGLAIVRHVNRHHPGTRMVLFTATSSEAKVHDALDLGVSGVVLKEMPPEALLQCVRKVHAGEQWLAAGSRRFASRRRQQRDPDRRRRRAGLTGRETDIVKLVARGLANEEIAKRLNVKVSTLKIHLHNIYRKLNVDSRLSLTLYVQGKGAL